MNLPQLTGYPSLSAIAVPTTLADAPIGVPLPPISVPKAKAQANGGKLNPVVFARLLITGTIVAAKGILSIMAEAKADSQRMIDIIKMALPPDISPIYAASIFNVPVCSSPPTQINRPIKNRRVRQSNLLRICEDPLPAASKVRIAAITPIMATDNPV
jgi:hypothetical protein